MKTTVFASFLLSSLFLLMLPVNGAENKAAPVAIPLVTKAEAEKLNAFAIFLSSIEKTVVEGEILERSKLPDPAKSDYPDCRFTALFNGNAILSGPACKQQIALCIDGFRDYKLLPSGKLPNGAKVQLTLIPYDKLPTDEKSIQQADDLNLFELDNYYVIKSSIISKFAEDPKFPTSGTMFSSSKFDEYTSVFDLSLNPPVPDAIKNAQNIQIANDKKMATELLENYDKIKDGLKLNFTNAWQKEKNKDESGYNRIKIDNTTYVWRNINNSFWTLPESATFDTILRKMPQENLLSLISLRDFLEKNGVQLLISIVPRHSDIASRVILHEFVNVPDYRMLNLIKELSEAGIETVYASSEIIKNYNLYPFAYFFPTDAHPADTVQEVLARIAAQRLTRFHFNNIYKRESFSEIIAPSIFVSYPKEKYTFHSDCDIGKNQREELYPSYLVLYDGEALQTDSESEILCWGNSFLRTPFGYGKYPMAYPARLAKNILHPVDGVLIAGMGCVNPGFIDLFSNPQKLLQGKKIFILQMGLDFFYSSAVEWPNFHSMDEEKKILSGKSFMEEIEIQGMAMTDTNFLSNKISDEELKTWSLLTNRKDYLSLKAGTIAIAKQDLHSVDCKKKVYCVIQASNCFSAPEVVLSVNQFVQKLPVSRYAWGKPRWKTILFELPTGTENIEISALCKTNTYFAIRSIKIYQ